MSLLKHIRLLINVTICWLVFVLIGLPNYYQNWPFTGLLYFCILVYFVVGIAIYLMTRRYEGYLFRRALWVAFYITVPLALYDYVYVQLIRGESFELLNRFWYLAIFYVVPWFQAPLIYFFIASNSIKKKTWIILSLICFISAGLLYDLWATYEGGFFDFISDSPEKSLTIFESALRLSIFGTFVSVGVLSIFKFIKRVIWRVSNGKGSS